MFAKEFYQRYGGVLSIVCPPSIKYDNIYERISERYLLSGDIKNEIIQLYKSELLNILLKDINGTFSIQCDGIQDISGSRTFWCFVILHKN